MDQSENVVAIPQERAFKMPQFGKRVQYLKGELQKLATNDTASVMKETEIEADKFIHKVADWISEGTSKVEEAQKDVDGNSVVWPF